MPLVKTNESDISINRLKAVLFAIRINRPDKIDQIFIHLSPQEIATIINNISDQDRKKLISSMRVQLSPKVLAHLSPKIRKSVINDLNYTIDMSWDNNEETNIDEVIDKYTFQTVKLLIDNDYEGIQRVFDN